MSTDELPTLNAEDLADTWGDLMSVLQTGEGLPNHPFWLAIGDSRFRVTPETRDTLSLGMLLLLCARSHFGGY